MSDELNTAAYAAGFARGRAAGRESPHSPLPGAVSIPAAYLGGDGPVTASGFKAQANVYASGYGDGYASGQQETLADAETPR